MLHTCLNIIEEKRCVGCGNCVSACPTECFVLAKDPAGFVTAQVKNDFASRCKKCGLCEKRCPEMQKSAEIPPPETIPCYAAWHKDPAVVQNSTSGGAFYALACSFLARGGIVAGVAMQSNTAVYRFAASKEELNELQGSKYIPADITEFYPELSAALESGRAVMITLLPCTAKAIRLRFHKYIADGKLFIIDFICAGVPAPEYFRKEMRARGVTIRKFRVKDGVKRFWKNSNALIGVKVATETPVDIPISRSPFYNGFACNLILRKSCYDCNHATLARFGDITLADFWGETRFPEQQKAGISMILLNTETGKELFADARKDLIAETASLTDAARKNPRLYFGKKHQMQTYLYRKFPDIISWAPLFVLNFLYGGGYRRFLLRKLPYKLLWRKHGKTARALEMEREKKFEDVFNAKAN